MQSDSSIRWPQIALNAVAERDARIPTHLRLSPDFMAEYRPGADGLMNPEELEITDLAQDATSILQRIRKKELTAVQVLLAFAKRAAIAHQLLCCLTEFFMESGLARARELDDYYERTGELVGPLHGLPISLKDHIHLAGHKSTAGFSSDLLQPPATKNALIAQILYDAGAVFYCKTNLPQSIMHLETYSFWGQTLNPYNTNLTPGGSSGGCGALVAFGGSPLSVGSDIGGSVRSPAANCGLWTIKATTWRVPKGAVSTTVPGADSIVSTLGPLCRSLRDMDLWLSVTINSKPWLQEPHLIPIPWQVPAAPTWSGSNGRIKIGVMWHDGVVLPQPPIRRALKALVDVLKTKPKSFEIIDYTPFKHFEISELVHELYFIDGGAVVQERAAVTGEPILPLTQWVVDQPRVKNHSAQEIWEMNIRRDTLRAEYVQHFNGQNVDVVLCPSGAGPAPALGTCKYWGYTNVWNFLDYPAATFPTGLYADPAIDLEDTVAHTPMSEADAYNSSCYKASIFTGAPLCLQLVHRRFHDELLVKALEEISKLLPLE
ncbi:amidase signature domain-containing protein [Roridomyces roridus]|uniref:amidase n=1 Tax=Roridomyces roridus TaxID=1738132 RepID=A0AAD7FWY6_9AGAR|nr:amidase signature domain-containing protein [Roridomyces roridus]